MKAVDLKFALRALTAIEAAPTAAEFETVVPAVVPREVGAFRAAVAAGEIKAVVVDYNGNAAFTLFFHHGNGEAWFNGCLSHDGQAPAVLIFMAAERIAKAEGCRLYRFSTVRAGLVDVATKAGCKVESLVMVKEV